MRRSKKRRGGGQSDAALEAKGLAVSLALEEQRRRQSTQGGETLAVVSPQPIAPPALPGFVYDAATDRYYPKPKGKHQQQQQKAQPPLALLHARVDALNLDSPVQRWLLAREVCGGRHIATRGSALDALLAGRIRSRGVYTAVEEGWGAPLPVSSVPRLHFDQLGYHCCFADRYVNFAPTAVAQAVRAAASSGGESLALALPSRQSVPYCRSFQALDVKAHPASDRRLVQAWLYSNHISGGEVRVRIDNLLRQGQEPFDVKIDEARVATHEPVSRIEWISCREALFLFSGDRIREFYLESSTPLVTSLQDAAPRAGGGRASGPASMRAWHVWRTKHEQEKLVLVARRNGCIQLVDVRTGLGARDRGAREAAVGALPFCPQHIVGLGDGHTVVASDICGTVRLFDVRGGGGGGSGGRGHLATIVPTDANTASLRRCNDFWVAPGEGMIVVASLASGLQLFSIRGADQTSEQQPPLACVHGPANTVVCPNNAHMLAERETGLEGWLGCFGIAPTTGGNSCSFIWPALDGVF